MSNDVQFSDEDQAALQETLQETGEQLAEQNKPEQPTNETQPSTEEGGEEAGQPEEAEAEDQVDQDLRAQAEHFGLNPDWFASSEALRNQVRQYEQMQLQWYRQQQDQARAQPEQQQQPRQEQQQPEVPFKLDLDPEEYPQELIDQINGAFESVHQHYQPYLQRMQQLEEHFRQQQVQQEQQVFDQAVGELQHGQLFGDDPRARTPEQQQNAARLYQEAETLAELYRQQGRQFSVSEVVQKAEQLAFGDQIKQYQDQTRAARMKKQANKKLGSGTRRSAAFEPSKPWEGEPEDNPVLIEAWNKMAREAGER